MRVMRPRRLSHRVGATRPLNDSYAGLLRDYKQLAVKLSKADKQVQALSAERDELNVKIVKKDTTIYSLQDLLVLNGITPELDKDTVKYVWQRMARLVALISFLKEKR